MTHDLVIACILALIAAPIADAIFDVSTRLARRLVLWSADRIYATKPERAAERAKEWISGIENAPKGLRLGQATLFAGVAIGKVTARRWRTECNARPQGVLLRKLIGISVIYAGVIVIALSSGPGESWIRAQAIACGLLTAAQLLISILRAGLRRRKTTPRRPTTLPLEDLLEHGRAWGSLSFNEVRNAFKEAEVTSGRRRSILREQSEAGVRLSLTTQRSRRWARFLKRRSKG